MYCKNQEKEFQNFFFKEKFSKTRRNGEGKALAYLRKSSRIRVATQYSEIYQRKKFTRGILVLKYAPEGRKTFSFRLVFKS